MKLLNTFFKITFLVGLGIFIGNTTQGKLVHNNFNYRLFQVKEISKTIFKDIKRSFFNKEQFTKKIKNQKIEVVNHPVVTKNKNNPNENCLSFNTPSIKYSRCVSFQTKDNNN